MKFVGFIVTLSLCSVGFSQNKTKLSDVCEQTMVDVIYDIFGRNDETFGVFGYKVIYEGSYDDGLAVVQTSDENEPRDMLVSYDYSKVNKSCEVKYKETLADGMVADFGNSLVSLENLKPKQIAQNYLKMEGKIISINLLGNDAADFEDSCLLSVKTSDEVVTLVTGKSRCLTKQIKQNLVIDSEIVASVHKDDQITNELEIKSLEKTNKAKAYYFVQGSEIKRKAN